jgi:hypothetical protein
MGVGLGAALAVMVTHWGRAEPVVDPRIEAGCHWPRAEGEMTVVTVLKGEVVCWRWR